MSSPQASSGGEPDFSDDDIDNAVDDSIEIRGEAATELQPTPKSQSTKKRKKGSSMLLGLETDQILELENSATGDRSPTSTQHHHATRTRLYGRGKTDGEALYNLKYHPMDDSTRRRRAMRLGSGSTSSPTMPPLNDNEEPDGDEDSVSTSSSSDEANVPQQTQREQDPKAERHSSRLRTQNFVNYSQKIHPQDKQLKNAGIISHQTGRTVKCGEHGNKKRRKVEKPRPSQADGAGSTPISVESHTLDTPSENSSVILGSQSPREQQIIYIAEGWDYLYKKAGEFYWSRKQDNWYSGPELRKGDRHRYANTFQLRQDGKCQPDVGTSEVDSDADQEILNMLHERSDDLPETFNSDAGLDDGDDEEDDRFLSSMVDFNAAADNVGLESESEDSDLSELPDFPSSSMSRCRVTRFDRSASIADSEPERIQSENLVSQATPTPIPASSTLEEDHAIRQHLSQNGVSLSQLMLHPEQLSFASSFSVGQPKIFPRSKKRFLSVDVHEDETEPSRSYASDVYANLVNNDASQKENVYGSDPAIAPEVQRLAQSSSIRLAPVAQVASLLESRLEQDGQDQVPPAAQAKESQGASKPLDQGEYNVQDDVQPASPTSREGPGTHDQLDSLNQTDAVGLPQSRNYKSLFYNPDSQDNSPGTSQVPNPDVETTSCQQSLSDMVPGDSCTSGIDTGKAQCQHNKSQAAGVGVTSLQRSLIIDVANRKLDEHQDRMDGLFRVGGTVSQLSASQRSTQG